MKRVTGCRTCMQPEMPPPLPKPRGAAMSRRSKFLIGLSVLPTVVFGGLILLRLCGLLRPFSVPTGGMRLAVSPGDHFMMEGFSFLSRQPRRGDIVVFKADGLALLSPGALFVQRVAGEPGDHIRISEGKLFINDRQISLSNETGEIAYNLPPNAGSAVQTDVTVSSGCYFVLGDNSANSLDSRYWGCLPRTNIIGRVSFCYWPPQRAGRIK